MGLGVRLGDMLLLALPVMEEVPDGVPVNNRQHIPFIKKHQERSNHSKGQMACKGLPVAVAVAEVVAWTVRVQVTVDVVVADEDGLGVPVSVAAGATIHAYDPRWTILRHVLLPIPHI